MEETKIVWHVYTVQMKFMGKWQTPRIFDSCLEAYAYYKKVKDIVEDVRNNPYSSWAILEYEDVRIGEDGCIKQNV